jgi:hypothetical protein
MDDVSLVEYSNFHKYINYELIHENRQLVIFWDVSNKQLDVFMNQEIDMLYEVDHYLNGMWIEKIKEIFDWEKGLNVGFFMSYYTNSGRIIAFQHKYSGFNTHNKKIDENGYFCVKPFVDNKRLDEFVRCNCMYNDILDQELLPYVMK